MIPKSLNYQQEYLAGEFGLTTLGATAKFLSKKNDIFSTLLVHTVPYRDVRKPGYNEREGDVKGHEERNEVKNCHYQEAVATLPPGKWSGIVLFSLCRKSHVIS